MAQKTIKSKNSTIQDFSGIKLLLNYSTLNKNDNRTTRISNLINMLMIVKNARYSLHISTTSKRYKVLTKMDISMENYIHQAIYYTMIEHNINA
jgi:hypothetical protein